MNSPRLALRPAAPAVGALPHRAPDDDLATLRAGGIRWQQWDAHILAVFLSMSADESVRRHAIERDAREGGAGRGGRIVTHTPAL